MALQNSTIQELRDLTFALIGREYANTSASYARLISLWNYAANKAHRATNYWERYLVIGDEREVVNKNQISRDEDGKDSIDTFLKIYKNNPKKARGGEYKFVVNAQGATLTGGEGRIFSELLDLYESQDGDSFYLQPDSSSSSSDPTVFVTYKKALDLKLGKQQGGNTVIPEEFMAYMAHYAAYTWQRSVEQNASDSNFQLSLALVNSVLEDELAKISDQNIANSYIVKSVRTNYNQTII